MWIVGDSFDYYGSTADLAHSVWSAWGGGGAFGSSGAPLGGTPSRFNLGQYYQAAGGDMLTKNFGSNEPTIHLAVAVYMPGTLGGSTVGGFIRLQDGATNQCCICFDGGGTITLRQGDRTGAALATFPNAFLATTWTHFQFRVVIDPATGTFTVRKNGQPVDTFAATGLNTRGSPNSYANAVVLGYAGGLANNHLFDDFLCYSGGGAAPNTWVGDVRAICLPPVGDTAQKQFAVTAAPSLTFGSSIALASQVMTPGWIYCALPLSPPRSGPVTSIETRANATFTGHVTLGIYANDGPNGAPGTLVATANEVTNPPAAPILWTFATAPVLSSLRQYYVALIADGAFVYSDDNSNSSPAVWNGARPYASGFPNPAGGLGTGTILGQLFVRVTVGGSANTAGVSEPLANGDTDYVYDATVGDEDLYQVDSLPVTPIAIVGVVTKLYCKKSDSGTRQAQIRLASGATEVGGVDTAISSTYGYLSRVDTTDPNTGAAWTAAAVNACKIGQKVTL